MFPDARLISRRAVLTRRLRDLMWRASYFSFGSPTGEYDARVLVRIRALGGGGGLSLRWYSDEDEHVITALIGVVWVFVTVTRPAPVELPDEYGTYWHRICQRHGRRWRLALVARHIGVTLGWSRIFGQWAVRAEIGPLVVLVEPDDQPRVGALSRQRGKVVTS